MKLLKIKILFEKIKIRHLMEKNKKIKKIFFSEKIVVNHKIYFF